MAIKYFTLPTAVLLTVCQLTLAGRQLAQAPTEEPAGGTTQPYAGTPLPLGLADLSNNPFPALPDVAGDFTTFVTRMGEAASLGFAQIQQTVTSGLETVQTAATNVLPNTQAALSGFPSAISTLASALPDSSSALAEALPQPNQASP